MDYNDIAEKRYSGREQKEQKILCDIVKMIQQLDEKTLKLVYYFVRGMFDTIEEQGTGNPGD